MDESNFVFFKRALLGIIGVLIVLLGVVGIIAVFTINTEATQETAYPQTTTNIYKIADTPQEVTPTYQPSSGLTTNEKASVQTTVNVRVNSGYSYYPRSRDRYYNNYRTYRYSSYRPYGHYDRYSDRSHNRYPRQGRYYGRY